MPAPWRGGDVGAKEEVDIPGGVSQMALSGNMSELGRLYPRDEIWLYLALRNRKAKD